MIRRALCPTSVLLVLLSSVTANCQEAAKSPLELYVHKPDSSYSWKVEKDLPSTNGVNVSVIDLVSQTWRTKEEVNQPEWRHWLVIAYPSKVRSNTGFLYISGGSNRDAAPDRANEMIRTIAEATGTVVAELRMVPNQPLIFHNDGQPRVEDDLIGYTWDQYLKTGDPTWVARNPMIKSAVRAMDTMTAFMETKQQKVDSFVVAGGSKRGWTTWLTGALDDRVVGIIPIVIDVLNADKSMRHHFAAYGFWAPSIGNYVQHKIMERIDHPRMKELYRLVDPYYYLDRLTMPKLILNGAGDQFFLPDSSQFYWDDLQGPKYLRYVPNGDHGLDGTDAIESVVAFYSLLLLGTDRPDYSWTMEADGAIRVTTKTAPKEVRLWQATNPEARDFRVETLGRKYVSTTLQEESPGEYVGKVDAPESGWTAYFVELTFDVGLAVPLKLTTGVRVVPDILPFEDKDPGQPGTVTVVCNGRDKASASQVSNALRQVVAATKLPITELTTNCIESTIYINFTADPTNSTSVVGKITGWLTEQGCNSFRYQLESGSIVTLPPAQAINKD
jgi:PhoPQ-activated pathogenicity-related protein